MTTRDIDAALQGARRCLLASRTPDGPAMAPAAFWFDGHALWLLAPSDDGPLDRLRADPACAVYVPPASVGQPAVVARGLARRYAIDDPLALLLHGPTISAAVTALTLKQTAASLRGSVRDLTPLPSAATRAVVRVALADAVAVDLPSPGAGVAPALPRVIPAEVRRELAGRRRVVVAWQEDDLRIGPAVWSGDAALEHVPELVGRDTPSVAVGVDADEQDLLTGAVTVSLQGPLVGGRLQPRQVTWWHGRSRGSATVPDEVPGAVELPD